MASSARYEPVWPETVVLWGAGATASLGMPTTAQQAKCLTELAADNGTVEVRVRKAFEDASPEERSNVADLLTILGNDDDDVTGKCRAAVDRQLPDLKPDARCKRARALRRTYDWATLRRVIRACPRKPKDISSGSNRAPISLMDLFNLLDFHIQSGSGFHAPDVNPERSFIPHDDLVPARRALQLLITLQFVVAYRQLMRDPNRLQPYAKFAETLASLMLEEGELFARRGEQPQSRAYNLFGYTVISTNWDPLLLWTMFDAHRQANNGRTTAIGSPTRPQNLFNDLGYLMAMRKVEASDLDVWYAMNESVVHRLNDPAHRGDRFIRFGKYYLPHGSFSFRECPNCGKVSAYLGDEWKLHSQSLFPPLPLPYWSRDWRNARTAQEKSAHKRGEADALQCIYCGTLMSYEHVHLTMQSGVKGTLPPYLEELQRDMRVALENARHIVFMGYSLPPDDVQYRSVLAARLARRGGKDEPLHVSLIVGRNDRAPDRWLEGDEIERSAPTGSDLRRIYRDMRGIAGHGDKGKLKIRAYGRGIPEVFHNGDKASVRRLLFPDNLWTERR